MFKRRFSSLVVAVLAAGSLALLPGCDWLKGSDSGSRLSPFLSGLNLSRSSVLCGQTFSVSFQYEDEQGDISSAVVTFQRNVDGTTRTESPAWPENQSRTTGTVTFEDFTFTCGTLGGLWTVKAQLVDERGHESNTITAEIRLNAPE